MHWIRHEYNAAKTKAVIGMLAVFLFIAFIFLQFAAAGVITFALAIAMLQWQYAKHVGSKLQFSNRLNRKRVLNGGESEWQLDFENKGMPIWGGNLKIWFQDAVMPASGGLTNYTGLVEMDVPFTIGFRENLSLKIPVTGSGRGLARLKKMELSVPLLFGEGEAVIEYQETLLQELLVYPKIHPKPFTYSPSLQKPGHFNLNHSLFSDPFQPIGTREYVPTDQFQHIHWKASARMQSFQTKIFSPVANESMLFMLDVAAFYGTIPNLEARIEELASYVDSCFKESVPFALAINIRSAGAMPYLFLPAGDGQVHRQRALELLALISKNHSTLPFRSMAAHLDMHIELPLTTFLLAEDLKGMEKVVASWSRRTQLKVIASPKGSGIA